MSSTYERMRAVISALGFTSNEKFEDSVGLGHGFVNRIKSTVSARSMDKIRSKYPKVNPLYIKAGIGDMFSETSVSVDERGVNERFKEYLAYKNITRQEFLSKTGLSQKFPTVPNNGSYSTTTTYKVTTSFPDLNLTWLLYGVGDMLQKVETSESYEKSSSDYKTRIMIFCEEIGISKAKFLVDCKSSKTSVLLLPVKPTDRLLNNIRMAFPQLNIDWLILGKGKMLNENVIMSENNVTFIPLVPQQAHAGYLCGYSDGGYISKLPTIPFVKMGGRENYMAFEVMGNSMDDGSYRAYQDGDIVICKECPSHIVKCNGINTKNKEFVIIHKQGILLKSIVSLDLDNGTITLHSFNPLFSDVTLNLEDVMQIWCVEYQQKKRR